MTHGPHCLCLKVLCVVLQPLLLLRNPRRVQPLRRISMQLLLCSWLWLNCT
jgi:hypothetical protein